MADLNERIEEPDETQEFSLSAEDLESVDPDDAEDIDAIEDDEEVDQKIDPVFDDDEEVLNDNLGYEE